MKSIFALAMELFFTNSTSRAVTSLPAVQFRSWNDINPRSSSPLVMAACTSTLAVTQAMKTRTKRRLLLWIGAALLLLGVVASQVPSLGAALILHPLRRPVVMEMPSMCEEITYPGDGVDLKGWRCEAVGPRKGTLIFLHGHSDNRTSGTGIMERFRKRGFDVVTYDSRSHGESGGTAMTYGFYEKEDLRRVIDTVKKGPIVLLGCSLGAAVSLQLAADDRRISAVVAAETFADLRTVVTERAPFFFPSWAVTSAIRRAEREGRFEMDAVSPALAARTITSPVLLIHGEVDSETPPRHSQRVFDELSGPKRLIIVSGAGHNESLHGDVWKDIEQWIDTILSAQAAAGQPAIGNSISLQPSFIRCRSQRYVCAEIEDPRD